jgi:hypothetical protein
MRDLDRLLKNKNEFLKYSYMILSSKGACEADQVSDKKEKVHFHRVISNLMGSKGKSEIVICGPSGRWHLTRLDKNESKENQDFTELKRGDLVYVNKIPPRQYHEDGDLKIEKGDVVQIIKS